MSKLFPILAWCSIHPQLITQDLFTDLASAGFNISLANYTYYDVPIYGITTYDGTTKSKTDLLDKTFLYAKLANIKLFWWGAGLNVDNSDSTTAFVNYVNSLETSDVLAGWFLGDEIHGSTLAEIETAFNSAKSLETIIKTVDLKISSHQFYTNFLPYSAKSNLIGYPNDDYDKYITNGVSIMTPSMFSYDIYPIHKNDLGEPYVSGLLFPSLLKSKYYSEKYNLPLWTFVLSTESLDINTTYFPEPTLQHMRFEVFCGIAYGSLCILYFTYLIPIIESKDSSDNLVLSVNPSYLKAPLNYENSKAVQTNLWSLCLTLNKEILLLADFLVGRQTTGVGFYGYNIPDTYDTIALPSCLYKLSIVTGNYVLISTFTLGTDNYIMFLNPDIDKEQVLLLYKNNKLDKIVHGEDIGEQFSNKEYLTIPAGDYVIYKINEEYNSNYKEDAETTSTSTDINLIYIGDKRQFPILAWLGINSNYFKTSTYSTEGLYKLLGECGFNILYASASKDANIEKIILYGEDNNIKHLLQYSLLESDPETYAEKLKSKTNIIGYFLKDEPKFNLIGDTEYLKRRIFSKDTTKSFYVNLYPNIEATPTDIKEDYQDYLNKAINIILPSMLSYDSYPIYPKNTVYSVSKEYFVNLEVCKEFAQIKNLPLWTFIRSCSLKGMEKHLPDMNTLRYQAICGLAYGSLCLQYFTYCTLPGSNPEYIDAPVIISYNSSYTPISYTTGSTYTYCLNLNKEIQNLSFVFFDNYIQNVNFFVGNPITENRTPEQIKKQVLLFEVPENKKLSQPPPGFTSISATFLDTVTQIDDLPSLLISLFTNINSSDNKRYYYILIVNSNINNPEKVNIVLNNNNYQIINKEGTAESAKLLYTDGLNPGDYLLFRIDSESYSRIELNILCITGDSFVSTSN